MRLSARLLAACLAVLLLAAACAAEGFSFEPAVSERPAPASLDGDPSAAALLAAPRLAAQPDGASLRLTAGGALPEGLKASVITADGAPCEVEILPPADIALAAAPDRAWLHLHWDDSDARFEASYLIQQGEPCSLWEAAAITDGGKLTFNALSGIFTLSLALEGVVRTEVRYDRSGRLLGALLVGDTREQDTLPLTVQYDPYGRAAGVTAADLQYGYTFNRAQGSWYNDQGQAVALDALPAFTLSRHPAPAAREIAWGDLHLSEERAGIDRNALLAGAPVVSDVSVLEGQVRFSSDADEVILTVDSAWAFDSRLGSLIREGTVFTACSADMTEESVLTFTLTRGGITAVYEQDRLVSVTDRARGIRWTADGQVTLENGAATAVYSPRGALSSVMLESPDGATLTYDARGALTGLTLDGYLWTRKDGWKTTAVNEKGNVIHPSVSQPSQVNPKDYPALTYLE